MPLDFVEKRPEFSIQAFLVFLISNLVLHLGQAFGLFTRVSQP
jgi:hypothetical protein